MKSTIRVEMDFNIKEPVLQITLDKESTDLSDQTLRYFIECASNRGLEVLWPFSHEMNNIKPQLRIKKNSNLSVQWETTEELIEKMKKIVFNNFSNNLTEDETASYANFFATIHAKYQEEQKFF